MDTVKSSGARIDNASSYAALERQGLLAERAAPTSGLGLASVLLATLLLVVMSASVIIPKLASQNSQFVLNSGLNEPICIPSSYCILLTSGSLDRVASGYRVAFRIDGAGNLFEIAKKLDDGAFKAIVAGLDIDKAPVIQPRYDLYINYEASLRYVEAFLLFNALSAGRLELAFEDGDKISKYRALQIERPDVSNLDAVLSGWERLPYFRALLLLAVSFLAAVASFTDASFSERSIVARSGFAIFLLLRLVALLAAGAIAVPTLALFALLLILIPWLAILRALPARGKGRWQEWLEIAATSVRRLWRSEPGDRRPSAVELAVLALALTVFAYMLWFGSSFRWSIFEERDLLETRQLVSGGGFPIYGPELLMGGHTVGSSLYLLLAPLVAVWDQPEALHLLNQLLFLGMPLVLWWAIRGWAGPAGALFAVFALVASERLVALSYWPIHPNFSLVFAFIYAGAVLRGAVAGHRVWLLASGLLLGVLTQLHFSYFLLVLPHVLLVSFGKVHPDRWTKPLAIAAVFVPLVPFLLVDGVHGFPNIAQIVQRPRFHGLYPNVPFSNIRLPTLLFDWLRHVRGLWSDAIAILTLILVGLGIAVGLGSVLATKSTRPGITASFAATLLFCVPLGELTLLGMGYNSRHTIALLPAMLMLAGFGFAAAFNLVWPARQWMGMAAILPLLLLLGLGAASSVNLTRIAQSEGEWAVDYESRQKIAADLAARLGLRPEIYAKRSFWWWIGWSIDPAIYAETYQRLIPANASTPPWPADQYVLVTAAAELPPFLKSAFEDKESRAVGGMFVHVATPKNRSILPSSNAITGVRLSPFMQDVDLLREQDNEFARIGHQQHGRTQRDLFLATVAQGRIKLLLTFERSEDQGRGRLRWCLDSPSLNGHYQEFKTLWRPRVVVWSGASLPTETSLAGDVLGSLLYKAPACGEASSEQASAWQARFAIDGLFDQSFMPRPELRHRQWVLDFDAPIRSTALSQEGISEWLDMRFDY
jgi:hypothetical protein